MKKFPLDPHNIPKPVATEPDAIRTTAEGALITIRPVKNTATDTARITIAFLLLNFPEIVIIPFHWNNILEFVTKTC